MNATTNTSIGGGRFMYPDLKGKVVVITGASSGLAEPWPFGLVKNKPKW
jgi:hypothetical protein